MNINNIVNWIFPILILLAVVFLQIGGYYNRVYVSVLDCNQIVEVSQISEDEWQSQYDWLSANPRYQGSPENQLFNATFFLEVPNGTR